MLFIGVFVYLLLISAILAVWLSPALRQWCTGRGRLMARACGRSGARVGSRLGRVVQGSVQATGQLGAHGWALGQRHGLWLAASLGVLCLVPLVALWLRQHHAYDGFDHTASREVNPQIAALLHGEQLVPPAPLPPELFLTREVEQARPATATASRSWELLDAEFRSRLLAVYRVMKEQHGIEVVLLEGYRSPQRQAELAAMGSHVTLAKAGQSYHQYGLAADSAFLIDGRVVISERDPRAASAYELFGSVAQSAGLVWGGAWRSLKDLGHVELRRAGVIPAAPPSTQSTSRPTGQE